MALIRTAFAVQRRCYFEGFRSPEKGFLKQTNFEGVFNAFAWNDAEGFGYTKNDELVLVGKEPHPSGLMWNSKDNDVWMRLIQPSMEIDHIMLRNELQFDVLSYDSDAIYPTYLQGSCAGGLMAVYRANVNEMLNQARTQSLPKNRRPDDDQGRKNKE